MSSVKVKILAMSRVNLKMGVSSVYLKAIESNRHGKMKRNQFLIEHLGIQRLVVVIFNISE